MTVQTRPRPALQHHARLTYEEFLQWPGMNQHIEWVNGEVVEISPVTGSHARCSSYIVRLLGVYAEATARGEVFHEPFQMKTGPRLPGRAPDVIFVRSANLKRVQTLYLDGPADLVVEIVSPGSRRLDSQLKRAEYEKGGVPEYWLIDPARKHAVFHLLGDDGKYQVAAQGSEGEFESRAMPGLNLDISWFWTQKPVVEALRSIGLL